MLFSVVSTKRKEIFRYLFVCIAITLPYSMNLKEKIICCYNTRKTKLRLSLSSSTLNIHKSGPRTINAKPTRTTHGNPPEALRVATNTQRETSEGQRNLCYANATLKSYLIVQGNSRALFSLYPNVTRIVYPTPPHPHDMQSRRKEI